MPILERGTTNKGQTFTRFMCDGCQMIRTTYPDGMPAGWTVVESMAYPYKYRCDWCQQWGDPPPGMTHEMMRQMRNSMLVRLIDQCVNALNLWDDGEDLSAREWVRLNAPLNSEEPFIERADVAVDTSQRRWALWLREVPYGKKGAIVKLLTQLLNNNSWRRRGRGQDARWMVGNAPCAMFSGTYETMLKWQEQFTELGAVTEIKERS